MKYRIFKDRTGMYKIKLENEFEEFEGMFWYESASKRIHKLILEYIDSTSKSIKEIDGNEYVYYLSNEGLSIQPIEAFEPDLNSNEFPKSKIMSFNILRTLLIDWHNKVWAREINKLE